MVKKKLYALHIEIETEHKNGVFYLFLVCTIVFRAS